MDILLRLCPHEWGTSLDTISQPPALAQGAISGKAERGRGHLAGKGQPCTQAAPKGAWAARGRRPGGHHAAAGIGRAALSGTCASTQPPVLQVGDWQEWSRRRAGRAERERQPCWPLRRARSAHPAPCVHAHGPARVHTELHTDLYTDTHVCAHGCANTHTCVRGPSCMCTHRYAHGPGHTRTWTYTHTYAHKLVHMESARLCPHTQPLLVHAHTHRSVHACTATLSTHICTHRAYTPHASTNTQADIL